jgi:uncharacterized protein YndB with AHSA1/START domain
MSPDTVQTFAVPPVIKTVTVRCPPEKAFRHFTEGMGAWWPIAGFHVAPEPEAGAFEPRLGGRLFERSKNGVETPWGRVLVWEPPHRLAFSWEVSCSDPVERARVDVSFTRVAAGTEVKLVHTGWEHMGEAGARLRDNFDKGWVTVFEQCYADYANSAA